MRLFGKSDTGKVREMNQDNFTLRSLDKDCLYAVVCDGMGGHNGGNIASELAVRTLDNTLASSYDSASVRTRSTESLLSSTIKHTNGTIFALSLKDDALKGMGTTVVLAYYIDGRMYVAHVGDSRAYLFDGEKLTQITKDHSIVQEMLDRGELTEEQARIHPYKHVITRVLGVTSDVEVDINILDFTEEDVLILCSDGLTNMLSEDEIEEILGETPFKDSCQELISRANERGGQDNITVALICGDKAE